MYNNEDFLKEIKNNIEKFQFHITLVQSSESPRFAYTIGNLENFNFELILAGNENFLANDIIEIFNKIILDLKLNSDVSTFYSETEKLGKFKISEIDRSWTKLMMLGVYDYYNINDFRAFQILPDNHHHTLDVPNMMLPWNSEDQIWKWLDDKIEWDLKVPRNSKVITEIDVLFGDKITEVTRWEADEWEAFTQNGEDVDEDSMRIIPINTLIGIDASAKNILDLSIEHGLWRENDESDWNEWK
ncbi:hypothetical protein ASG31_11355 [Chryseobacterium sp. Leaf404]|uniref:DUF4262 domain-containing protein n=1 Tax=unclassified Chryseobacterium TaxID=2593645 RepID=UPI0006F74143|nr:MULTISPECIES: DUF4262 domain-containing protein [unclassified Chryseobacterium]KQT16955.1 hypothetical protein ASG31_11355 [Chryseobacterium sp. Leaf404]